MEDLAIFRARARVREVKMLHCSLDQVLNTSRSLELELNTDKEYKRNLLVAGFGANVKVITTAIRPSINSLMID